MWPFTKWQRETSPSLLKRLHELEARVEQLELQAVERHMTVLDSAEKVAHALEERSRKRAAKLPEPEAPPVASELAPTVSDMLARRRAIRGF
jgi:hypothetical protein